MMHSIYDAPRSIRGLSTQDKFNRVYHNQINYKLCNLLANSVSYIFRFTLSREIGWKFWGEYSAFPSFGNVTIVADSISGGKEAEDTMKPKTQPR